MLKLGTSFDGGLVAILDGGDGEGSPWGCEASSPDVVGTVGEAVLDGGDGEESEWHRTQRCGQDFVSKDSKWYRT